MALDYFPAYHSYLKKCEKLSDQEVGRLFRCLLNYSITGERPELTGRESIAFDFIADDIDRAKENYEAKSKRLSDNAKKRYEQNEEEDSKSMQLHAKACKSRQSKSKSESNISRDIESKPAKHKYGEFQHVLLTDEELEKLKSTFPDYLEKIRNLDEYIENKHAKYNNHYLTIRNWARRDAEAKGSGKRDYGEGGFQEW